MILKFLKLFLHVVHFNDMRPHLGSLEEKSITFIARMASFFFVYSPHMTIFRTVSSKFHVTILTFNVFGYFMRQKVSLCNKRLVKSFLTYCASKSSSFVVDWHVFLKLLSGATQFWALGAW